MVDDSKLNGRVKICLDVSDNRRLLPQPELCTIARVFEYAVFRQDMSRDSMNEVTTVSFWYLTPHALRSAPNHALDTFQE